MEFKSLMHISFFTDQLDVIRDFYENKLGAKAKMVVRNRRYKGTNNPLWSEKAETDPDGICIIYFEVAPRQFVEFFPKADGQEEHIVPNKNLGYSHFSLLVDDIYKTKEELIAAGIAIDQDISKGKSETYQMWIHDPDGNNIEIMQFTEESEQLKGTVE